ncbi:MAG: MBL fold metallo-hydrolase, partial [Polyangiales bacterium]
SLGLLASACGGRPKEEVKAPVAHLDAEAQACAAGRPMRVHFYDVGQGLAVLVTLPDGQQILVDAGDAATRPGCGLTCAEGNQHLLGGLSREAKGGALAMVWITHQHSDHMGGASDVLQRFKVGQYVDNGREPLKNLVEKVHTSAAGLGVPIVKIAPGTTAVPMNVGLGMRLTAITPAEWPEACGQNPNDCSIGLRIDYCKSSVLFTGDAEEVEEAALDVGGPVTLLQVAHHGSDTSSSAAFLAKAAPKYAVISSGKPNVGLNHQYCHPRKVAVDRVTAALGATGQRSLETFDGTSCKEGEGKWTAVRVSDRLFSTARDGDIVLMTTGNGEFKRE